MKIILSCLQEMIIFIFNVTADVIRGYNNELKVYSKKTVKLRLQFSKIPIIFVLIIQFTHCIPCVSAFFKLHMYVPKSAFNMVYLSFTLSVTEKDTSNWFTSSTFCAAPFLCLHIIRDLAGKEAQSNAPFCWKTEPLRFTKPSHIIIIKQSLGANVKKSSKIIEFNWNIHFHY